ncbi:MAG: lipoyl(octanoyl) transferase LipB [Chitinophagaceae bacterium]|nr:lipoyl(octanoyl) transferase LipB [Chitinophagaceae bacterium]
MAKQKVIFRDLGQMDYEKAWHYQEELLRKILQKKAKSYLPEYLTSAPSSHKSENLETHYLLFVEHPPVYTLGKSGNKKHLLLNEKELEKRNIQFFHTNRGGDITFHGYGQLVGYPILDLEHFGTDIGRYLRNLEEVIILTLKDYGIEAKRSKGETGVWIDPDKPGKERKICAIGVRCSRWVTMHGFALNVNTDLHYFQHIIPCGIRDKKVTSMKEELGRDVSMEEVKDKVKQNFETVFDTDLKSEFFF